MYIADEIDILSLMNELAVSHRKSYVYFRGIPLHTWWYSQKKLWFSHCELNIDDFEIKENTTDSDLHVCENFVIWWDQILRHPIDHPDTHKREQMFLDVFTIAKQIYDKVDNEIAQIFMLLAIRHSNHIMHKKFVCEVVRERIADTLDKNQPISTIWFRFWKASLQDYMSLNTNVCTYTPCNTASHVVTLWKEVPEYINHPLYTEFCTQMNKVARPPLLTVSLSGGVDSMVLAYCASKWCHMFKVPLSLLHIQYNNRPETDQEIEFLTQWIGQTMPSVPFYIRSIDEIQRRRESKWRTLYEDITRQYRFQAYSILGGHVLLGHNYDDTIENILTNITSQTHYDNMKGMELYSQYAKDYNVSLYRPFLTIRKKDIYQFAETFDIPHLPDSTPKWSRRGMLRDKVMPALDVFDENILSGLSALSQKLTVYRSMYVKGCIAWIRAHLVQKQGYLFTMDTHKSRLRVHTDMYYSIPYDVEYVHQMEFWDIFISHVLHTSCSAKSKERLMQSLVSSRIQYRLPLTPTLCLFIEPETIHLFRHSMSH